MMVMGDSAWVPTRLCPVSLKTSQGEMPATIYHLPPGACQVFVAKKLAPGALKIALDASHEITAQVRWCKKRGSKALITQNPHDWVALLELDPQSESEALAVVTLKEILNGRAAA